jgi:uncharacterized protein involved in exopolysaccharide biosynthesis
MIARLWSCKELALIAAIVTLACVAAYLSIKLTRPKPFASATLSVEWQCKRQSSLITTSTGSRTSSPAARLPPPEE